MNKEITLNVPESTLKYYEDVARAELEVRQLAEDTSSITKIRDFMIVDCLMWGSGERSFENKKFGVLIPFDYEIINLLSINKVLTEDHQKRKGKDGDNNSDNKQ